MWNVVIASTSEDIGPDQAKSLRSDLLSKKGSALIEQVYGTNPPGFISLIGRFGRTAQTKATYDKLFDLVSKHEKLTRSLAQDGCVSVDLIEMLDAMPKEYRSLRLVKALDDKEKVRQFVSLLRHLEDNAAYKSVLDDLRRHIWSSDPKSLATCLHNLYRSLEFEPPIVPDSAKTRYLHNGRLLEETALAFRNCLKEAVPSAVRGEAQYYVWKGDIPAVVSITRHRNRWAIEDIRGRKNRKLMKDEQDKIYAHFAEHGVTKELDFSELLERFILPSSWEDNPFANRLLDTHERFDMEYQMMTCHQNHNERNG